MKKPAPKAKPGPDLLDEQRLAILNVALKTAGVDGWSGQLLDKATKTAQVEDHDLHLAFPDGIGALLNYFCLKGDDSARALLSDDAMADKRIREKIAFGVRTRLDVDLPYKSAVRTAVAAFARPVFMSLGASVLYRTADMLWLAAGDDAQDYNRYTKRLILSGVYSSTLMVWLSDTSQDRAKTWGFLDNRIEDVMRFEKTKARARTVFNDFLGPNSPA